MWSFVTKIKDSTVFGFEERYQPEVVEFEKQWDFERSSGYAGYRNKASGEWIYDSDYRKRKRAVSASIDVADPTCTIEWSAELEVRENGIKSISAAIKKVSGTLFWSVDVEDMNEQQKQVYLDLGGAEDEIRKLITGEIEINTDREIDGKKWEVESKIKCTEGGAFSPDYIEIDFKKLTITIQ